MVPNEAAILLPLTLLTSPLAIPDPSGAINAIYDKWFQKPVPPKGINLSVPMSDAFKKVIKNPTDSGDQNAYK